MSRDPQDPAPVPRGRPKADHPGSTLSVWVSQSYHDRLIRLAEKRDQSVSATVRELLHLKLK
jgi:hypothetical protein